MTTKFADDSGPRGGWGRRARHRGAAPRTRPRRFADPQGPNAGSWSYAKTCGAGGDAATPSPLSRRRGPGDGVPPPHPPSASTGSPAEWVGWQLVIQWSWQSADGTGSMTVAGSPRSSSPVPCCGLIEKNLTPRRAGLLRRIETDKPLEDAYKWLGNNFAVTITPATAAGPVLPVRLGAGGLLKRAAVFRQQPRQKHDWYREGASLLVARRIRGDPVGQRTRLGTSFASCFSKGAGPQSHQQARTDRTWKGERGLQRLEPLSRRRPQPDAAYQQPGPWPKLFTRRLISAGRVTDLMGPRSCSSTAPSCRSLPSRQRSSGSAIPRGSFYRSVLKKGGSTRVSAI